jgi:hypothetical protein
LDRIREEFKSLSIHVNKDIGFKPIVDFFYPSNVGSVGEKVIVTAEGNLFTSSIDVSSTDVDISDVKFVDDITVKFTVTVREDSPDRSELIFSNLYGSVTYYLDTIRGIWSDFRLGSDVSYQVESADGTKVFQKELGLVYNGKPWSGWYKLISFAYPRSESKEVTFIVKSNSSAFMLGLFSGKQNGESKKQYYEFEIAVYSSGGRIKGFYGTDKNHKGTNRSGYNIEFKGYYALKIVFTNNGTPSSAVYFYGLENLDNFDDASNLLGSEVIPSIFTANGETLVPALVCNAGLKLVGLSVK